MPKGAHRDEGDVSDKLIDGNDMNTKDRAQAPMKRNLSRSAKGRLKKRLRKAENGNRE